MRVPCPFNPSHYKVPCVSEPTRLPPPSRSLSRPDTLLLGVYRVLMPSDTRARQTSCTGLRTHTASDTLQCSFLPSSLRLRLAMPVPVEQPVSHCRCILPGA